MLNDLKESVFRANIALINNNLVIYTWGNVSGIDREKGLVVIKPSGVHYDDMKVEDMVIVDLDGNIIEGSLKPSSDTPTHLELYRRFCSIGGIVHTHSEWATSWAQAGRSVPVFGTTHADDFYGEIPCTRFMRKEEVDKNYELNIGKLIVETFSSRHPSEMPGVLVAGHGPYSWGKSPDEALHNAVVMEQISKMAYRTIALGNNHAIDQYLLDKRYLRRHGKDAYYGQVTVK